MADRRLTVKAMDAALVAGIPIPNVAAFCREHDVTPRTFYRHRARIRAEGRWEEHSRRPHTSPAQTQGDLEAWILKLRADLAPDNGADFIRTSLEGIHAGRGPDWSLPSRSTINRVLSRHRLLERTPQKRPRSSYHRFQFARPRDCYQIDGTWITLADGGKAVVFDVLDDCTRLLVACHAAPAETSQAAIAAIRKAFQTHGVPGLVLTDNGTIYTSRFTQPGSVPTAFAHTVTDQGARLIHSSPYHPQTCGKVERHHQTLKKWLATQPAPATIRALQRLCDTYRRYYNQQRPHTANNYRTPEHAWTTAIHHGGPEHLPIQTDATVHHCTVYANGTIGVGSHMIGIGIAHHGTKLTAIRNANHATIYTLDGQPLGHATFKPGKTYTPLTKIKNK